MMRAWVLAVCITLAGCTPAPEPEMTPHTQLDPQTVRSGYTFLTPETQALQDDAFSNPGLLWVDRGEALFKTPYPRSPACISCHSDELEGVAATYPKIHGETGKLTNLEGAINYCVNQRQGRPKLDYESDDLLSLTAFIARQSAGEAHAISINEQTRPHLENAERYFFTRRGQFNLSCAQCHNENWGAKLRGDTISQGHINGFPAYRLEWQGLGSSHRRLRDCDTGVRAAPLPYGDIRYIELELYLAARATDLAMEAPAVRR